MGMAQRQPGSTNTTLPSPDLDSACSGSVKINQHHFRRNRCSWQQEWRRRKQIGLMVRCGRETRGGRSLRVLTTITHCGAQGWPCDTNCGGTPLRRMQQCPVEVRFWALPDRNTNPTPTCHRLFLSHAKRSCRVGMVFQLTRPIYSAKTPCSAVTQKLFWLQKACISVAPPPTSSVAEGLDECGLTYRHITTSKHRIASQTAAVQHSVRYLII
ncbi:hypothetical protein N431DRAFT_124231 [Stipitochalara longipes BDJ]|nr:hypothetical protein N431DRAFT_124231 [Stipitochalara longipes BDJ]